MSGADGMRTGIAAIPAEGIGGAIPMMGLGSMCKSACQEPDMVEWCDGNTWHNGASPWKARVLSRIYPVV